MSRTWPIQWTYMANQNHPFICRTIIIKLCVSVELHNFACLSLFRSKWNPAKSSSQLFAKIWMLLLFSKKISTFFALYFACIIELRPVRFFCGRCIHKETTFFHVNYYLCFAQMLFKMKICVLLFLIGRRIFIILD